MPRCYADPNPIFQPAMRLIAAITQSDPMVVTTTFAHQYIDGMYVRLYIPLPVGMPQANELSGYIVVTSPTTFTLPVNSTSFEAFVIPVAPWAHDDICAQVVPVGEENSTLLAAFRNVLPF